MKITTKTGDTGKSSLFSGKRLKKDDRIFDLLGNLDELNSILGWTKAKAISFNADAVVDVLDGLQDNIYRMMSIVGFEFKCPQNIADFVLEDVELLEKHQKHYEQFAGEITEFVKPGENELSSRFHICRSVCRRAERSMVFYLDEKDVNPHLLMYLNRLSDLLYILAVSF